MRQKIPFLGGQNKRLSPNQDAQRTVNLYLDLDPEESETGAALYLVQGKQQFASVGTGPVQAMAEFGGSLLIISGGNLYTLTASGVLTLIGGIAIDAGVAIEVSKNQAVIVGGTYGYVFDGTALTRITADGWAGSLTVANLYGFFVMAKPDSQTFYVSAQYDGSQYDPTDFAEADSFPDQIVAVFSDHQDLMIFGEYGTEFWYYSGELDFPFSRRDGSLIEVGCSARYSIARGAGSVFWLGRTRNGKGQVYRCSAYQPQVISNNGIEAEIAQMTKIDDARGFVYQQNGHVFYVLTFPSEGRTFVYDASIVDPGKAWHIRETYGIGRDRGNCYAFFAGTHLVGDYSDGTVWELRDDVYTDGGLPICWERTTPRIYTGKRMIFRDLILNMQRGTGLPSGDGSDPVLYLDWSDDGGHTWSNKREASMGAQGIRLPLVRWWQLGSSYDRVFRITGSSPVKTVILGGYLTAETGNF